ncbi:hypothetical protein BiPBO1_85 [Brucella phage BiPBO1]|uniref:hypothetical protein n=1 Tax=Brucella phage BiPBO1 TaxID=1718278 RepID=UPI00030E8D49|nr:hypothetical protein [Brucella inopinata]YP_009304112.1 hypothetical protein BJD47_gp84 [Brucella phage BiPBO1]ALJ98298.1 hypothetical protein BiPBO1_85 [Brucella phage BiPBO1]KEY04140.1 hypothetical protein IL59_0212105 [Brucella suis bv. 4 str. 40]
MNRRRFLSFLGLAPVAAAVPAMALARAENVKNIVTGEAGPEMVINSESQKPLIFKDGKLWINPANVDAPLYDTLKHGDDFEAWWNRVKS